MKFSSFDGEEDDEHIGIGFVELSIIVPTQNAGFALNRPIWHTLAATSRMLADFHVG